MTERRRFNAWERAALYAAAGGLCESCGRPLPQAWHADHHRAYSKGGPTDVVNGSAKCPGCNLSKGAR
jgi:5-methylcytosine-specific restriction endonuclease McrA